MLNYLKVINQSNSFKMIDLDVLRSRLSHAYLFVNPDENYLKMFAETVSKKFINLNEADNIDKNNLRIENRTHPDVIFLGEDKNIDTAAVSSVVESSNVSPFEADKKIFVMLGVENMNESSQNKILKSIEEPPRNTFYLMCATSVNKILPTILSRVKKIDLDELSSEQICELLKAQGIDEQRAMICANCANGNGCFAEKLASDENFIEFFNNIVLSIYEINGSRDVLKFSNLFSAKNIDKEEFIDIAVLILRDVMMVLAKKEEFVLCRNLLSKLKQIASLMTIDAVQNLIETCYESKKKLNFNVNSTAVIDNFLFKIAEVKVKCRRLLG